MEKQLEKTIKELNEIKEKMKNAVITKYNIKDLVLIKFYKSPFKIDISFGYITHIEIGTTKPRYYINNSYFQEEQIIGKYEDLKNYTIEELEDIYNNR